MWTKRMYLFLISPNNSGTTVMSQYIAQRFDFYLPPFGNNEGQFAPAVESMMRDRRDRGGRPTDRRPVTRPRGRHAGALNVHADGPSDAGGERMAECASGRAINSGPSRRRLPNRWPRGRDAKRLKLFYFLARFGLPKR